MIGQDGKFLGNLSANQFDPDSINNPFGKYGSAFAPDSVNNEFGSYGSQFAPESARNEFASKAPTIVDPCGGKYLGQLSANPFPAI